ncbi:hypothetical protein Neosp_002970 [[Neocosmospora] mangrovei]
MPKEPDLEAAKSIVIILYQVLSQHTKYFRKWMSFKANLILNCLEIVFWSAVAFMTLQANTASCTGVNCALGWVILVLGIIMWLAPEPVIVIELCIYLWSHSGDEEEGLD